MYDDVIPFSAITNMVIEEGDVSVVIDGYLFNFTIHEYSNGTIKLMLDSDTLKARNILKRFGVSFTKKTLNEINCDEFIKAIHEIYSYSNSRGGDMCSWVTDEEIDYKEFN